jgi:hypothetical protein
MSYNVKADNKPKKERKDRKKKLKKEMVSAVGFEPTPAYADQNTPPH